MQGNALSSKEEEEVWWPVVVKRLFGSLYDPGVINAVLERAPYHLFPENVELDGHGNATIFFEKQKHAEKLCNLGLAYWGLTYETEQTGAKKRPRRRNDDESRLVTIRLENLPTALRKRPYRRVASCLDVTYGFDVIKCRKEGENLLVELDFSLGTKRETLDRLLSDGRIELNGVKYCISKVGNDDDVATGPVAVKQASNSSL